MRKYRRFIAAIAFIFVIAGFLWAKEQYVVPILMYHRIDDGAAISKISVSRESFKRQMSFLKRHNYNIVSLEELSDLIKNARIPYKTIAITFDDGYENNYTDAYPVLKEMGVPATIFISPGLIGRDGYLGWDEVIEMSESSVISIGSHAMSHAYLPDLSAQDLDVEIFDSKRAIEGRIGKEVNLFSYPMGGFNDYVRDKVIEAGYRIAAATNPGRDYPAHDLFAMKRLRISRTSDNLFVFWIETSGFYTWIKEHRDED